MLQLIMACFGPFSDATKGASMFKRVDDVGEGLRNRLMTLSHSILFLALSKHVPHFFSKRLSTKEDPGPDVVHTENFAEFAF